MFPRLAHSSLEPDEHFVLKDLLFYEFACLADSEARQARLEEQEKKRQEGTLKQASVASRSTSNFAIRPPTQKKKLAARLIQKARTLCPATLSSSFVSSPSSSLSSSFFSNEVEVGVNQLVPPIICEEEKEEEMTSNLRFGFRERQCMRLSKYIVIDPFFSKKARPTPGLDSPSKLTPLTSTTVVALGSDEKPFSIGDISYHEMRKPFFVLGNISED